MCNKYDENDIDPNDYEDEEDDDYVVYGNNGEEIIDYPEEDEVIDYDDDGISRYDKEWDI